jgi:hypothetical protein
MLGLLIDCGSDSQPEQTGLANTPAALDWPGTEAALAELGGPALLAQLPGDVV